MSDRTAAPTLMPVLRSEAQARVLTWIFLNSEREHSIADIARRCEISPAQTQREVERLHQAGLIVERRVGRSRLVAPDLANPATRPLTELLAISFGPEPRLAEALKGVSGIEAAFIYGSWAARRRGEPGPLPDDIDVLVVGNADEDLIAEAVRSVERELGRDVNFRQVRPERWHTDHTNGFLRTVRSRPTVNLIGEPEVPHE